MAENKFAEAKEVFDALVSNIGECAANRFHGIESDNDLDDEINHQIYVLLRLGVSWGIIDAIADAASYYEMEDDGSSSDYHEIVLDFLEHRVMEEVKKAENGIVEISLAKRKE